MFGRNTITGKKYFEDPTYQGPPRLNVTSMFYTFQGEGPHTGKPALFIRLAKCNLACSFCFVAGTMITMGDGKQKRIEDVKKGDIVLSWDGEKFVPGTVTTTMQTEANELVSFRVKGKLTTCTPEHPILVKDKGWVEAKDIEVGDVLIHLSVSERMRLFNPMKDPAVAIKGFLSRKDRHVKSSTEIKVEDALDGMGVRFVGNGDLIVANKCPDFVVEGQKKLIEVWDDERTEYWRRDTEWREKRRKAFADEGWEVLFMPVTRHAPTNFIRESVGQYINNGLVVTEVNKFKNPMSGKGSEGKRWTRYSGRVSAPVKTYNFEVEGTHTYVANNIVVHNCDAYFEEGDWMTVEEILTRARTLILEGSDAGEDTVKDFARLKVGLVLTGGEPMLQDVAMAELFTAARNKFAWHQIETNGTQNVKAIPKFVDIIVSPKCLEKSGKPVRYLEVHPSCLDRAAALKFVVTADKDSPYNDIPEYAKTSSKPIYVSPMNTYNRLPAKALRFDGSKADLNERSTTDEVISFWEEGLLNGEVNKRNHEYTAKLAVKRGYIFCLQSHLYASMA